MENHEQIIQSLLQLNNIMTEQIVSLSNDNISLKQEVENLKCAISELISNQKSLIDTISKNQFELKMLGETMTRSVDNVPYELGMGKIFVPKIASVDETVDIIAHTKSSICRFNDGEFSIMMGCSRQPFQHQDDKLAKRLIEIIRSNHDGCLIAIADNYSSLESYSSISKNEIRYYMTETVRAGHAQFLDPNRTYYNAHISTPYMLYSDRTTNKPRERFNALKEIWDNKDIIIVEGRLSRLGVGNDLFCNCHSIKRILCPPEQAFNYYDEILEKSVNCAQSGNNDNTIFIIALGPTATVLAYDLHERGYKALDLGHIDKDYEFFINNCQEPIPIPGKHFNNIINVEDVCDIHDESYDSQIVDIIHE